MKKTSKKKPPRKLTKADEATLRRIPKQVEVFLKDLQQQMQTGAIDLTDWRSLGVGILNRISQVSATLRNATGSGAVTAGTSSAARRAKSLATRAIGVKKAVRKAMTKSKTKKAKKH